MSVKVQPQNSTVGETGRGYSIPAGSLNTWKAARNAHATTQTDVTCTGDSTTEGVPASGNNTGGWVAKLRALSIAAGYTDGGRGQIDGAFDTATASGESFAGYVSKTGWASAAPNSTPGPYPFCANTVADVLTLQYKAPNNAMRIRLSSNTSTGRLTVKVNGSTVGTIDPWVAQNVSGSLGTYGQIVKRFTGLTAGGAGQTVTIENTGGAPIPNPFQFRTAGSATTGGAVVPGTYTYAATFVDAAGLETALSPVASITVPAGTSTNTVTTAMDATGGNVPPGLTKARLYRANGSGITLPSSFQMVLETTTTGGGQIIQIDVGNAPGAAPPNATQNPFSNPATTGPKAAGILVDFYDSTKGITYHRAGYSGQKYFTLYSPSGSTYATCQYDMQTHLGLVPGLASAAVGMDWSSPADSSADARKVSLAMCAFGINDMNNTASGTLTADLQAVAQGCATFIKATRSAGADPLVIIPHLEYAGDATHYPFVGLFREAILNTADAHGCAWVDFNEALGPPTAAKITSYGGVHLTQTGYDAEATFLWINVLSK
jgi:lysophospholipase L1-like esterase